MADFAINQANPNCENLSHILCCFHFIMRLAIVKMSTDIRHCNDSAIFVLIPLPFLCAFILFKLSSQTCASSSGVVSENASRTTSTLSFPSGFMVARN